MSIFPKLLLLGIHYLLDKWIPKYSRKKNKDRTLQATKNNNGKEIEQSTKDYLFALRTI